MTSVILLRPGKRKPLRVEVKHVLSGAACTVCVWSQAAVLITARLQDSEADITVESH